MSHNKNLDIEAIENLRKYLRRLGGSHASSLAHYASENGEGFWHQPAKRASASLSSTATCVSSLIRAGRWNDKARKWGSASDIVDRLLRRPWQSAGLDNDNPFSLAFIAEGVLDLIKEERFDQCEKHEAVIHGELADHLVGAIESDDPPFIVQGSVSIKPYPPSAYLTQLAFRVLQRCLKRDDERIKRITVKVCAWAWAEINRQIALIATSGRTSDPLQLAYAIVLAVSASVDEQTSPEQKALISGALRIFFNQQDEKGGWKPSQPLFHYPAVGNAQCFEYELMTQLLTCEGLQDELIRYLPHLERIARRLDETYFELDAVGSGKIGWASGHHPQIAGPESWSTACVYDFVHALDRLVAEAARRALFEELKCIYSMPRRDISNSDRAFARNFLDAELRDGKSPKSLVKTLKEAFVDPIDAERNVISNGGKFSSTTPMSAILYGPPGTSKTQLAKMIGEYLGWPLLSVDPSYLVQDGLDHLYARADRLFSMLVMAEQIVVLLDEFDEMGRERSENPDALSRFITTSMLPKLAAINQEKKIVVLLATNYVSRFDIAFSRGGRFDMMLQVLPPTLDAKLSVATWRDALNKILESKIDEQRKKEVREALGNLTYLEIEQLMKSIGGGDIVDTQMVEYVLEAKKKSTMERVYEPGIQWKDQCEKEAPLLRIPPIARSQGHLPL
jgi:hypothetical protein